MVSGWMFLTSNIRTCPLDIMFMPKNGSEHLCQYFSLYFDALILEKCCWMVSLRELYRRQYLFEQNKFCTDGIRENVAISDHKSVESLGGHLRPQNVPRKWVILKQTFVSNRALMTSQNHQAHDWLEGIRSSFWLVRFCSLSKWR